MSILRHGMRVRIYDLGYLTSSSDWSRTYIGWDTTDPVDGYIHLRDFLVGQTVELERYSYATGSNVVVAKGFLPLHEVVPQMVSEILYIPPVEVVGPVCECGAASLPEGALAREIHSDWCPIQSRRHKVTGTKDEEII